MIEELNLTPRQEIAVVIILIVLLVAVWRHKSYLQLDSKPTEDKTEETRNAIVQARYGAVIQVKRHY